MKKVQCSIDNYVCDNNSICREERQYALYLSNVLRKYYSPLKRDEDENVNRIFNVCRIPETATIQHVFYEAAFMRDFFKRNRMIQFYLANVEGEEICEDYFWKKSKFNRSSPICKKMNKEKSFNRKLFRYCWQKLKEEKKLDLQVDLDSLLSDEKIEEVHYGVARKDSQNMPEKIREIENLKKSLRIESSAAIADKLRMELREMMNSKPDIAVIYEDGGTRYLLFLECKFESYEKSSNSGSLQTKIQWKIADFLCENRFFGDDELCVSPKMVDNGNQSIKVVFTRNNDDNSKINIGNLIKLEQEIFE